MATKTPAILPVDEPGYRAALHSFFDCMRGLADKGVLDACEVDHVSYSQRPGSITTRQYLMTPFGRLRFFTASGSFEAELTTPEGETMIATIPYTGLIQSIQGPHHPEIFSRIQSKNVKRVAGAWLSALDRHLEHDILSVDGDRAVIGLPGAEPVSLQTIANMLHILVRTRGLSGHLPDGPADRSVENESAFSQVAAPFLFRPIEHETRTFRNCQLFQNANVILQWAYGQSIRPRIAVTASRRQWRGTKDPVYFWQFDLHADTATAGNRLRFSPMEFSEAETAEALGLAHELGLLRSPKAIAA